MKVHQNWVRRVEHSVLRLVSFVFSVVSAHAILWFFSALDWVDLLQPWVKWGIAGGFGILGYFVCRGLAHRLLNRERVRAYVFICAVFELVEVVCNYSMAASSAEGIVWVSRIHGLQHQVLVVLIYVVLSIIPVVTVMLAWVDMDLERAKQGYEVRGFGAGPASLPGSRVNGSLGVPLARPMPFGGVQPKGAASAPAARSPVAVPSAMSPYTKGYGGAAAPSAVQVPAAPPSEAGGFWSGVREGVGRTVGGFPFGRREPEPERQLPPPLSSPLTPPTGYGGESQGVVALGE